MSDPRSLPHSNTDTPTSQHDIELAGWKCLADLGAKLSEARDLHQATEWVTAALCNAWDWEHSLVWYRNRPTGSYWLYQNQGKLQSEFERTMEYTFASTYIKRVSRVIEDNSTNVINPVDSSIFANDETAATLKEITTIITTPLQYGKHVIGVVEFFLVQAPPPLPIQLDIITQALALLDTFVQERQQLNRAKMMIRVAKANRTVHDNIVAATSEDELLALAVHGFMQSFDYLHAIYWLKDPDGQATLMAQEGLLQDVFANIASTRDYTAPDERLLNTLAVGEIHVDNHPEEREWVWDLDIEERGVVCVLSLPILKFGEIIAALEFFIPYHVNQYDEKYFYAYMGIARMISLALERLPEA